MRFYSTLFFIAFFFLFSNYLDGRHAVSHDDGFTSMFNGKNLDGWSVMPPDLKKAWYVKGGVIEGNGDHGRCYLSWNTKEIADFDMQFSYRFPGKGNSGVNIRTINDPTRKRRFQSYHADLGHVGIGKHILGAWDFHTPGRREHGVSRGERLIIDKNDKAIRSKIVDPISLSEIKKTEWNNARIIAKGNNFQFYINGKLSAEFTEHIDVKRRLHKGMIQLQLHDPGMIVQFKDLKIKVTK